MNAKKDFIPILLYFLILEGLERFITKYYDIFLILTRAIVSTSPCVAPSLGTLDKRHLWYLPPINCTYVTEAGHAFMLLYAIYRLYKADKRTCTCLKVIQDKKPFTKTK